MRAVANVDEDQTAILQFACITTPRHIITTHGQWLLLMDLLANRYTLEVARRLHKLPHQQVNSVSCLVCFKAAAINVISTQREPIADV